MIPPALCECGHERGQHALFCGEPGPCAHELPAAPELELPAHRCPCRRYVPGPWRWHAPTLSWALSRTEPAA